MNNALIKGALVGGLRALIAGYVAGGVALGLVFLIYGVTENAFLQGFAVSLGIIFASLVLAPAAVFGLWFLLLPAFGLAFAYGLLFQRLQLQLQWLACASGMAAGVTIALLRDMVFGANFNWLGNAAYRNDWEFFFVLSVAGAVGGWFAYPAWFPVHNMDEASG